MGVQRDQRPDPRRLDAAPRAVLLLPVDHPLDGAPEGGAAERPEGMPPVGVHGTVEEQARGGRPALELVEPEGCRPRRLQRRRDLQSDDRLPRPAAERVDRERRPGGEEHLLRRQHGDRLPAPEAEQRQPHASEDPCLLEAAELGDHRAGSRHVLGGGVVAGEAQPDVRLDRGRQVGRAAEVGGEAAVLALSRADPARRRSRRRLVEEAEVVAEEQILGVDRDVGLQLALPVAVGVLQLEQAGDRTVERLACRADRSRRHAASLLRRRCDGSASAAAAAVRPLRTAPSIVAGQPVSVHAPAR